MYCDSLLASLSTRASDLTRIQGRTVLARDCKLSQLRTTSQKSLRLSDSPIMPRPKRTRRPKHCEADPGRIESNIHAVVLEGKMRSVCQTSGFTRDLEGFPRKPGQTRTRHCTDQILPRSFWRRRRRDGSGHSRLICLHSASRCQLPRWMGIM